VGHPALQRTERLDEAQATHRRALTVARGIGLRLEEAQPVYVVSYTGSVKSG
jgi:hypothetical protein